MMRLLTLLTCVFTCLDPAMGNQGSANFAEPVTIYGGATTTVQWGDIDQDGLDDDLFVAEGGRHSGGAGSRILAWFEAPDWQRHDIAPTIGPFTGDSDLVDVDGDGDLDVVISTDSHSSQSDSDAVYWYENTGVFDADWPRHTIEFDVPDAFHIGDMETGDVDGDGKLDVVVRHLSTLRFVVYFQNSADDWQALRINTRHREGLSLADLDANGRDDIIGNGFILFAPLDARNGSWTEKTFDQAYYNQSQSGLNNSIKSAVADMNNDGRPDIIMSSAEGTAVYLAWYQNPLDAQNSSWAKNIIEDPQGKNHQVQIADVDLDGDPDVLGGFSFGSSGVYWWENTNGLASNWQRHTITTSKGCYSCVAADFDRDGDIDLAGPEKYVGQVNLFENTTATNTLLVSPLSFQFQSAGGSQLAEVQADVSWTVTSNQSWLTLSPISGSNNGDFMLTASNHGGVGDRMAQISVSGGGIVRDLSVRQIGAPDLLPPTAPVNLQAHNTTHQQTQLSWSPSTDNSGAVQGYYVYQDGSRVNNNPTPDEFMTIANLSANTAFQFNVSAVDLADNESSFSDPVNVLTDPAPLAPIPFSYWRFDENSGLVADDLVGMNDGQLTDMDGTAWVNGQLGHALQFDGDNDQVALGNFNFSANTLTISAWIKPNNLTDNPEGRIISKASGLSSQDHDWMISTIESNSEYRLRFRLKVDGTTQTLVADGGALSTDVWSHLVATYDDNGMMKIYQDSLLVGMLATDGQLTTSNTAVSIGNQPQGDRSFAGTIDEVCVFNESLNLLQIQTLFSSTNQAPCMNLDTANDLIFTSGFE